MSNTICLLEFGLGHVECLYSQAAFLQSAGYRVVIMARKQFQGRYREYDCVDDFIWLDNPSLNTSQFALASRVANELKRRNISHVVINTFSGKLLKRLLLHLYNFKLAAVVHDLQSFRESLWRRWLSPHVRCFFVLNDSLMPFVPSNKRDRFASFYPIYFPRFPLSQSFKKKGELWVCIPGQLEIKRRNYIWLAKQAAQDLHPSIRFVLLGPSRHQYGDRRLFEAAVTDAGVCLKERFILFENFVPDPDFHEFINSSDVIMPLIFDKTRYLSSAISGSLNLAFAYHIPLLTHRKMLFLDDLAHHSIDYDHSTLTECLNSLVHCASRIQQVKAGLKSAVKFRFDIQRDRYISALERAWR